MCQHSPIYEYQEKRRLIEAENARTQRVLGHAEGRHQVLQIAVQALAKNGLSANAIAQELQIDITEVQKLL